MKLTKRSSIFIVAIAVAAALVARHIAERHALVPLFTTGKGAVVAFTEYRLDNGLRVILSPDPKSPAISVCVAYDVGSRDETPGQSGLAHLCEHLMFKGSAHVGAGEHQDLIESVGGTDNAETGRDCTTYFESVPSNQLPLALFLEADRMGGINASDVHINQVRREVTAEKQTQNDDTPYDRTEEAIYSLAYTDYAYQHPTMGSISDVWSVSPDTVRSFVKTYYEPNNAVLCICGPFNVNSARDLIIRYFAAIPQGPSIPIVNLTQAGPVGCKSVPIDDPASVMNGYIRGCATVPATDPDYAPLLILTDILADGPTSRLYKAVVDKLGASSVDATMTPLRGPSLFQITAQFLGPNEGIATTIDAELAKIIQSGVSEAEVRRAYNQEYVQKLYRLVTTVQRARILATDAIAYGNPNFVNAQLDAIRDVKPADIQRVARRYLRWQTMCEVRSTPGVDASDNQPAPKESAAGHIAPDVALGLAPIASGGQFALPAAQTLRLSNGVSLVLVEDHRLPLVLIDIQVAAGLMEESHPGIALMACRMALEGTTRESRQAFEDEVADCGLDLECDTFRDNAGFFVTARSQDVPRAMGLAADIVRFPAFDPDRLFDVRYQEMESTLAADVRGADILKDLPMKAIAGGSKFAERLARPIDIARVERADLVAFHARYYAPNRTVITVAGDISPTQVAQLAQSQFGDWAPGPALKSPAVPKYRQEHHLVVVDWPYNKHCPVELCCRAPGVLNPDHAAFMVANEILSLGPGSRLHAVLRNKLAATYSVTSKVENYAGWSMWTMRTDTSTRDAPEFVGALHGEFVRMQGQPVSAHELQAAKLAIIGTRELSWDSPAAAAGDASELVLWNAPSDFWSREMNAIQAVTAADVLRVSRRYWNDQQLCTIAYGPKAVLLPVLRPYGEVLSLDDEGRPFLTP